MNARRLLAASAWTAALLVAPEAASPSDPPWVELLAPSPVEGLRCVDADGDGLKDVLVVSGRDVLGFRAVRDGRPDAAPTWTWRVPPSATFVWPGPPHVDGETRTPMLLALAGTQVLRLAPGRPPAVEEGLEADARFADATKAVLAEFARGGTTLLLPTASGLRWVPDLRARTTSFDVPLPRSVLVTAPGPFVEDAAEIAASWPSPELVAPGREAPRGAVVAFGADAFHGLIRTDEGTRPLRRTVAGLPRAGSRRDVLLDLDGDGLPDLVREATTNDSGVYAFVPLPDLAPEGPPLSPRAVLRLTGFQLPPDYVDLDGDGRKDFVVTTIDIDGGNVMRAVAQGRVTARTRAFLHRPSARGAEGAALFHGTPDAEVESDIRVRIFFTFSGAIEVARSFTILATADLDGDGRKDLAIRTPDGALGVRRGTASGVWSSSTVRVALPPVGDSPDVEGYVTEATGDRRDDLVLLYRAGPGGKDRLYLLPSGL